MYADYDVLPTCFFDPYFLGYEAVDVLVSFLINETALLNATYLFSAPL